MYRYNDANINIFPFGNTGQAYRIQNPKLYAILKSYNSVHPNWSPGRNGLEYLGKRDLSAWENQRLLESLRGGSEYQRLLELDFMGQMTDVGNLKRIMQPSEYSKEFARNAGVWRRVAGYYGNPSPNPTMAQIRKLERNNADPFVVYLDEISKNPRQRGELRNPMAQIGMGFNGDTDVSKIRFFYEPKPFMGNPGILGLDFMGPETPFQEIAGNGRILREFPAK